MSAQQPANGELSWEEKERLVQERMEQMRIKNEELLKRHAEIEADKRNADLLSSSAVKDYALRKPAVTPPAAAGGGGGGDHARESKPPPKREPRVKPLAPREADQQRPQRLSSDEGPPPDPGFRFLADRMRDQGGDRGGSRRHRDNYGGQDFENVRLAMRQDRALQKEAGCALLPPKLSMTGRQRREYEEWKSERSSIDAERLQRQLDAEGNIVREWDLHKQHLQEPLP